MSTRTLERVTCTLPRDLVKAADAIARREGRSRSWVVAEALRTLSAATPAAGASRVSEVEHQPSPAPIPIAGLDDARLDSDLSLTPEQRIHAVEDMVGMAERLRRPPRGHLVLAFDRLQDYWAWKEREDWW